MGASAREQGRTAAAERSAVSTPSGAEHDALPLLRRQPRRAGGDVETRGFRPALEGQGRQALEEGVDEGAAQARIRSEGPVAGPADPVGGAEGARRADRRRRFRLRADGKAQPGGLPDEALDGALDRRRRRAARVALAPDMGGQPERRLRQDGPAGLGDEARRTISHQASSGALDPVR